MAKDISSEQMDQLMKTVTDGLSNVFDGIADVKCIKGNKDDIMGQMMDSYMGYPIINLKLSRNGCDIEVDKCNINDVINLLPKAIGGLLSLVPSENRNDIIYKAIQEDMSDEGGLMDRLNEEDDE